MTLERRTPLIAAAALATLCLAWLVRPLAAPIAWATIVAILFKPVERRVRTAVGGRRNASALITVMMIVIILIVPGTLLALSIARELAALYARMPAQGVDVRGQLAVFEAKLPSWLSHILAQLGLDDGEAIATSFRDHVAEAFKASASLAFIIGRGLVGFVIALGVMLYLSFFLLRDGDELAATLGRSGPLDRRQQEEFLRRFVSVIRATVSSTLVVGLVQGTMGGLLFYFVGVQGALLWGALMAAASLLPTFGSGFVWAPIGVYMMLTDRLWQGATILLSGLLVISTIDNILRPALVGRSSRMPEWLILIAILGGIELFGPTGIIVGPVFVAFFLTSWQQVHDVRTSP